MIVRAMLYKVHVSHPWQTSATRHAHDAFHVMRCCSYLGGCSSWGTARQSSLETDRLRTRRTRHCTARKLQWLLVNPVTDKCLAPMLPDHRLSTDCLALSHAVGRRSLWAITNNPWLRRTASEVRTIAPPVSCHACLGYSVIMHYMRLCACPRHHHKMVLLPAAVVTSGLHTLLSAPCNL